MNTFCRVGWGGVGGDSHYFDDLSGAGVSMGYSSVKTMERKSL